MPTASVSFAGLSGIRACRFPLTRGVVPSVFAIYMAPQSGLDVASGTLTFSQDGNGVQFTDCAVAAAHVHRPYDNKWPVWAVYGLDRRWKWQFKTVSGDYNRRTSDGLVDPSTSKTVQELASLLLQALGESGFDVSRMPSSVKPRCLWKNQRADLALQALCDYVACDVVLNSQSGNVEIWPLGLGLTTPTAQGEILPKYSFAPRASVPGSIKVIGGDLRWQTKLKLAAVTRDYTTGKQKKIESSEFKPSTGWDEESIYSFPGISSTNNRVNAYEQVWREYRVIGQADGSLNVPFCSLSVTQVDQYLLDDYLLETETDLEDYKRNLPCYLSGDYWAYTDLPSNGSDQRFTGRFKLYPDRRLVSLDYPLFKLDSSGNYAEPTLYLTTSYRVKDASGLVAGLYAQANIGGGGGELLLRRPEVFAVYSTSTVPGAPTNTESQAMAELQSYAALFQQKYANPSASEISYAGIVPLTPDGNIAQITWDYGMERAPTTTAWEQDDLDPTTIGNNERMRRLLTARLAEAYL